jgi:hypothetical protein
MKEIPIRWPEAETKLLQDTLNSMDTTERHS